MVKKFKIEYTQTIDGTIYLDAENEQEARNLVSWDLQHQIQSIPTCLLASNKINRIDEVCEPDPDDLGLSEKCSGCLRQDCPNWSKFAKR